MFFQALKHPILKHYYCPNVICKVYIGTSQPGNAAKCAVCGTPSAAQPTSLKYLLWNNFRQFYQIKQFFLVFTAVGSLNIFIVNIG